MVLEFQIQYFRERNHMISVKPLIRNKNEQGCILALGQYNMRSSKWDTIVEKA